MRSLWGRIAACRKPSPLVGHPTGAQSSGEMFQFSAGLDQRRLSDRHALLAQLDQPRSGLDLNGTTDALNRYQEQAVDAVLGQRAQQGYDLSREPQPIRDGYGNHLWCQRRNLHAAWWQSASAL